MKIRNLFAPAMLAATLFFAACGGGSEAPTNDGQNSETEEKATTNDEAEKPAETPTAGISHSDWDGLMQTYVSDGKVNYSGIRDDERFEAYLDLLVSNHPAEGWSAEETMAYWINAYNAFTIQLILENYPIGSITEIDEGKPWNREFIHIGDQTYSLDHIENQILRKDFDDPRIHFGIVCASFSCPPLRSEAFLPAKLDAQLTEQAKTFLNDTRRNNTAEGSVSQIFTWFEGDFTKDGSVTDYINKYAATPVPEGTELSYMEYDWSLNE